jgi:hypothetical protein
MTVAAERFLSVLADMESDDPTEDSGVAWGAWLTEGQKNNPKGGTRQYFAKLRSQMQIAGFVREIGRNKWATIKQPEIYSEAKNATQSRKSATKGAGCMSPATSEKRNHLQPREGVCPVE